MSTRNGRIIGFRFESMGESSQGNVVDDGIGPKSTTMEETSKKTSIESGNECRKTSSKEVNVQGIRIGSSRTKLEEWNAEEYSIFCTLHITVERMKEKGDKKMKRGPR